MSAFFMMVLVASLLVTLSLVTGLYSNRLGFSHMLVFLVMGMLAGVDGPLGLPFNDSSLSSGVGHVALAMILLDGGLRTPMSSVRKGLLPAGVLASVGVFITSALTGLVAWWTLGIDWRLAWLIGAVVASTDAAAVFNQLHSHGIQLSGRLTATIEVESGLNDPMAVFLTISLVTLLIPPDQPTQWLMFLAHQVGWGLAVGAGAGMLVAALLRRLPLQNDHQGLTALLLTSSGMAVFALAGWLEGSSFLAIYLFGLCVGHRARDVVKRCLSALNGFAWLAQAGLFMLLGLLVTPHQVMNLGLPALLIAGALMLVARPAAVFLCLTPLGFAAREQGFIAWVGLRGAVPIVLALFPVMAGVKNARLVLDVAFVVVLASLLLQGPSLGWLARRLRLDKGPATTAVTAPPAL